jgi:cullin-4
MFKDKLDEVLSSSFSDEESFVYALKESFEYFVNKRDNIPAELLAKFLDSKVYFLIDSKRNILFQING